MIDLGVCSRAPVSAIAGRSIAGYGSDHGGGHHTNTVIRRIGNEEVSRTVQDNIIGYQYGTRRNVAIAQNSSTTGHCRDYSSRDLANPDSIREIDVSGTVQRNSLRD